MHSRFSAGVGSQHLFSILSIPHIRLSLMAVTCTLPNWFAIHPVRMSVRKRTRQPGVLQAHTPRLSSLRRIPLVLLFVAIRRKTVQKVATSIVCNIALPYVCSEAVLCGSHSCPVFRLRSEEAFTNGCDCVTRHSPHSFDSSSTK